jgi:DNA repair exonuclease SbcCD ATPase subunit
MSTCETRASSEAQLAQSQFFVSSFTASGLPDESGDAPVRLAQAIPTAADGGATELRNSVQQERGQASRLEQDLAAARGKVETQTGAATDEADRLKQVADSTAADLRQSLQQERERANRLEHELAAARRELETQTAVATNAKREASRLKPIADNSAARRTSLQQERERAEQLERNLLALTKHGVETQTSLATKANDEASGLKQLADSGVAELQQSLQREHGRAEALAQELLAALAKIPEYEAQARKATEQAEELKKAAVESSAGELRKSLQRERARADQLTQNLASAKHDLETRTALAAKANDEASRLQQVADSGAVESRKSLRQQDERAEALAQELSTARAKIAAHEAQARRAKEDLKKAANAESDAFGSRKSLQQERERAEQLEQNLESAKRDLETQTALAAKAKDEASRLKQVADSGAAELKQSLRQENERAQALAQELSTARAKVTAYEAQARQANETLKEAAAAESGAVELRRSLHRERERAEQLEQNLASAKRDVDKQTALAAEAIDEASRLKQFADAGAVELRKSLQQERERAERLEQNFASTKRELETQTAMATMAKDEASRLKQVAESGVAELKQSLRPEHERTKARSSSKQLEDPRDLAPERNKKDAQPVVANTGTQGNAPMAGTIRSVGADQIAVEEARSEARPHAEDTAETAKLVARARVLLGQGDVGSARIVLERAAERGSAQANFALAETYDPLILAKWGTFATRGDTTKARELYSRAEGGGNKEAKQRLDTLR